MKFIAQLSHVSGYLRSGNLVGSMTQEEYELYLNSPESEQHYMLAELGTVEVTDWRIEDYGDIIEVQIIE